MATVTKNLQTIGIFTTQVLITESNNGQSMVAGVLYGMAGSADFGMKLPAILGLPIGSQVHIITAASDVRFTVSCDDRAGGATEAILGEGNDQGSYHIISGVDGSLFVFEYMGDASGNPLWLIEARSLNTDGGKPPVDLATTAALPAYTKAGTDENELYTAISNGALTVDGVAVSSSDPSIGGILLRHGAVTADNAILQVVQAGDGSNPFILKKRTDWHHLKATELGAVVAVLGGDTLTGYIYTVGSQDVGNHATADFVENKANSSGFQIDTYTNIDNDTTDSGALTLVFGTCYICDNAGVLNTDNLELELPVQTAFDKGKAIWIRARYSTDPHDWGGGGDKPPVAVIKPDGGDSILQAGGTVSDVTMAVNDDNVKFEAVGNGDWILG